VHTQAGRRFGFELVFFRQAQRRGPAENRSAWRADDLYLAHLALTDIDARQFRSWQRLNRAGPGIAGASLQARRLWNGNWSAEWTGHRQKLRALAAGVRLDLLLTPLKPPVIQGENGISRKAAGTGRASHYVSLTRLRVAGELDGAAVSGTAWMDHEWFTNQLDASQAGWDWFSIQLDNDAELMLYRMRRKDGTMDAYSSGTYVDVKGRARHLSLSEFSLEPLAWWTSPATGARYPVRWRVKVPSLGLELECTAALENQELKSENGAGPTYWEGAVTYSGTVPGVGYLEMTGYDKPVKF
jgi:predicted secreted hydrolase